MYVRSVYTVTAGLQRKWLIRFSISIALSLSSACCCAKHQKRVTAQISWLYSSTLFMQRRNHDWSLYIYIYITYRLQQQTSRLIEILSLYIFLKYIFYIIISPIFLEGENTHSPRRDASILTWMFIDWMSIGRRRRRRRRRWALYTMCSSEIVPQAWEPYPIWMRTWTDALYRVPAAETLYSASPWCFYSLLFYSSYSFLSV